MPVDAPNTDAPVDQEEPNTEAQDMSEVINQINSEPEVVAEAKPNKKTSRSKPKANQQEVKADATNDTQESSSSSTELPPEQRDPVQPPPDAPSECCIQALRFVVQWFANFVGSQ